MIQISLACKFQGAKHKLEQETIFLNGKTGNTAKEKYIYLSNLN